MTLPNALPSLPLMGSPNLTAGCPPIVTTILPMTNCTGPMNTPEITPPFTPGSSPLEIATIDDLFSAGTPQTSTVGTGGVAIISSPILGYGMGKGGAGGAGVRHTSGTAIVMPFSIVQTNITDSK